MITIRNATVVRSGKKLFEDFSWEIAAGENWVLSGNNGSGKTLLLELIAGSLHLPQGTISYDFITSASWDSRHAEKQRKIKLIGAHAIQSLSGSSTSLYYQQRYYAAVDNEGALVSDLLNADPDDLMKLQLPESLSIRHLLSLPATRLSNGQLRKVLLVKALLGELPELLLLDYPFEGLDSRSRKDLCDFIDYIAVHFKIQVILTDHHHELPTVIVRRLLLDNFKIAREEAVLPIVQPNNFADRQDDIRSSGARVIEIEDLVIRYGDKTILQDFNWTVNKGERWALIGRNGAGKTTLFSMVFADHPMAYSQKISLFGRRRGSGESIWDIKKRIGYLGPEIISFLNPKTITVSARDYVLRQEHAAEEGTLDYLIGFFDAENFFHLPVKFLSSGQLQLMEIIRCFSSRKEMLLLDEPFQFLDPKQQSNVRRYLKELLQPETTLILITHYEGDVADWAGYTKRL